MVGYAGLLFIQVRAPEYKEATTIVMTTRPAIQNVLERVASLLIIGGSALALVAIVLGVTPDLEAALYLTVVVLLLVQAAWTSCGSSSWSDARRAREAAPAPG